MTDRRAPTDHDIQPLIAERWSPRSFSGRSVEESDLRSLFEAARWAPSCFNEQPWRYAVATKADSAAYATLAECLTEGNRSWATAAPVLMLSIAKLDFAYNGKPNRFAYHDVGMATLNLITEASARGLVVHQMAGYSRVRARESLSIPDDHDPVAMIALGYLGDADDLSEGDSERESTPRQRVPIEEFVTGVDLSSAPGWL